MRFSRNAPRALIVSISVVVVAMALASDAILGVNVALFRFGVLRRLFGRHVQEEVFHYIAWALPVLVGSSAVALVLLARV